jgi:hypothetical protein
MQPNKYQPGFYTVYRGRGLTIVPASKRLHSMNTIRKVLVLSCDCKAQWHTQRVPLTKPTTEITVLLLIH